MLTDQRHETILALLNQSKTVRLADLTEATGASESTIRRDLTDLEKQKKLKRIHGGASVITGKTEEAPLQERTLRDQGEKIVLGKAAADLISDHDTVFLDAGSTTAAIIPYITDRNITVVTNGLNIITALAGTGIKTYVLGGHVKSGTHAFVGAGAIASIQAYQFDKAFLGMNSVDAEFGYSTPDPEEALIKKQALDRAAESYVLADHTKLGETSFSKVASLDEATLITTDKADRELVDEISRETRVEVVTA
ncbi:DeoR/GlpR family DNA-binding transcription regulator [Alteribacter natronophilus]|uniref:DeoR/GlpR family DNA-binding transcription regulator n=1 Tax=Alteribacter natronophilus TaxID=2583810 RepID=UPI00110E8D06|nr:DeoR/GlpR family DNA-binding transcription regulator [Alteribacter natronophilus]TMW71824.1 DeoR/GlpR transcriptional regulator [Alteribacter natronophilus]